MISWSTAYFLSEWIIRVAMLFYVPNRRSPAASRTWLLLIFLLPWPGLVVYSVIGRINLPRKRLEQQARAAEQIRAARFQMRGIAATWQAKPEPEVERAATLVAAMTDFRPCGANHVELMTDYERSIDALVHDIDAAKDHVHLLYYLFEDDATGRRVAAAIAGARQRGVTCRILMDAAGSRRGLRRLAPRLRRSGAFVEAALPVGLFRRNTARIDLRNHRKLAVIDGRVAHTGSQNITDAEFVPGHPNEELVARVNGPIVAHLQAVFLADYYLETNKVIGDAALFPELAPAGGSVAQVLPSGPGYGRENAKELMVHLIHAARKRVVITTPYFVPDEPFLQAMRTAVLRGVEVHLVLPKRSSQPVTRLAQQSYFDELLEDGVSIHLHRTRFLHAKHLSIDDSVALLGSSNIDIRSFALNAELSLLVYDPAVVAELRAVQETYFAQSERLTRETWAKRTRGLRTVQNIARLADSLL